MNNPLLAKMQAGNRRALSRLLTEIENNSPQSKQIIRDIYPQTGNAHIVGITGAPGSGKSTLVTQLAKTFRQHDHTVAIVAVDPSSPFSGGALLGDRVRMGELAGDPGIFIRSLASRGSLGGLAKATANMTKLLDAASYDIILIETVGAGQAEVDIANTAHTTLVIEAPGMGDEIQSIKAGILEIADILVVNKADKPGANKTLNGLKSMLHLGPTGGTRHHGRILTSIDPTTPENDTIWQIPVLPTVSTTAEGVETLVETILAHRAHLKANNRWLQREQARAKQEIDQLIQERLFAYLLANLPKDTLANKITAVANREVDVYTAVDSLLETIIK